MSITKNSSTYHPPSGRLGEDEPPDELHQDMVDHPEYEEEQGQGVVWLVLREGHDFDLFEN